MTEEKAKDTKRTKTRSGVSRREFISGTVGGVVVGAVVGAAAGSLGFPKTVTKMETTTQTATTTTTSVTTAQPWLPAKWDQSADVVIVGTGSAALSAAITAYDGGASVLLLEKLDEAHRGGSSYVAGNVFMVPMNLSTSPATPAVADAVSYLTFLDFGTVGDDIIQAQAQGYLDNLTWVQSLGGTCGPYMTTPNSPNGPGAAHMIMFGIALPNSPVQSYGYPIGQVGDHRLWDLLFSNVTKRNIPVLYQTPATELIQNASTKEILGLQATSNGATLNIKANKAVILACGSFEFDFDLQKQYWPCSPVLGTGSPGDTGDGIKMAQKVGAQLWHMGHLWTGMLGFIVPGTTAGSATEGGNMGVVNVSPPGIRVNKYGNRFNMGTSVNGPLGGFANENQASVSFLIDTATLDWDSVPFWAIFDDTQRKSKIILSRVQTPSTAPGVSGVMSWWAYYSGVTWSADNSAEVAKGWILSAPDLNTLASTIVADPDNEGKMTGAQLSATVAAYNVDVANKTDAQFFTNLGSATPITTAPFYAMKLWPTYDHDGAHGGPKRNVNCQVLNPDDQPIPRLYSAGELGAPMGWYASGSHYAENLFSGRVSGQNAAKETSWS